MIKSLDEDSLFWGTSLLEKVWILALWVLVLDLILS